MEKQQKMSKSEQLLELRKFLIFTVVLSLTLTCCIAVLIIPIRKVISQSLQAPKGAEISVMVPPEVQMGEKFEIIVEVENTQVKAQNLVAIGFLLDYLEGIRIIDSKPTYIYNESVTLLEMPIQLLTFQEMVLQGEVLEIRIQAEAINVGDFGGEIQVCLNSPINCGRTPTRTIVLP